MTGLGKRGHGLLGSSTSEVSEASLAKGACRARGAGPVWLCSTEARDRETRLYSDELDKDLLDS